MKALARQFVQLHLAPDEWTVEQYVRHAMRLTAIVWLVMTMACAVGGLLTRDPDGWMGEFRLYTYYTVFVLATCAVVSGHCAQAAADGEETLWRLMAWGFAFLAADDLFLIHENIDKLIHWIFGADPSNYLTNHLDDFIVLTYGVIGAAVVWRRRREVLNLRYFGLGIGAALTLLLIMVFLDATGGVIIGVAGDIAFVLEESFKGLGASAFFVTLVAARIQLRRKSAYAPPLSDSSWDGESCGQPSPG